MPDVSVPWGEQELKVTLPGNWTVQQVAAPEFRPAARDWPDRLAQVLTQPATGLSLEKLLAARRGGRITFILEDMTRHSPLPQILPVIMREVRHAKIPDEQVEFVFATGMHPPMTFAEAAGKLGEFAPMRWRCNPCHDPKAYVRVGSVGKMDVLIDRGVLESDLRIIVSSVSPHLQAGFGGGYKMLVPGCASRETIRMLHRFGLDRSARQMVGTDSDSNAMRQAIDAAGQLIDAAGGKTFAVQYVLDGADQPAHIAAGEVIDTQRMLAKQCAVACGIVPAGLADVLITNAFPRDFDLWQSFKCIANTLWAARPNGIVICLTRCLQGLNGVNAPPWPLKPAWTRGAIRWLGPQNLANLVQRLVPRLAGDAAFFIRMATQMLYRNPLYMVSPTLARAGLGFPGIEMFATAEEAVAAADRRLGHAAQRVTVFPLGGITYPVPVQLAARGDRPQPTAT